MSGKGLTWFLLIALLVLLVLALNFLDFQVAQSNTRVEHVVSTTRLGHTLPENMGPGATLYYAVRGDEQLSAAMRAALKQELEMLLGVGTAIDISGIAEESRAPLLLVDLAPERMWTPIYAQSSLSAQIYYAFDGDVQWSATEPMALEDSPAVKASGEFNLTDSSWGLVSKPSYIAHIADALAKDIAAALQSDVYKDPSLTQ